MKANWVEVHFEFRGGNPGLYLSSAPNSTQGVGTNLGSDGKWNETKVDVDMGRWNTVRFQRTGDVMKVYLNDRLCHSFPAVPASYVLVKAQRGELRVRKLFAFGYNP